MEATANYNETVPSLFSYNGEVFSISKCDTNSSVRSAKMMDYVFKLHMQLSLIHDSRFIEDGSLALAGKCCSLGYNGTYSYI